MKPLRARRTYFDMSAIVQCPRIERFSYHGVLAHQDDGLTTESRTDFVHLLGRDIVDGNNEDGLVLVEKVL